MYVSVKYYKYTYIYTPASLAFVGAYCTNDCSASRCERDALWIKSPLGCEMRAKQQTN